MSDREAFERRFPVSRTIEFCRRTNTYHAREPYTWGADAEADKQTLRWIGWRAACEHKDSGEKVARSMAQHGVNTDTEV